MMIWKYREDPSDKMIGKTVWPTRYTRLFLCDVLPTIPPAACLPYWYSATISLTALSTTPYIAVWIFTEIIVGFTLASMTLKFSTP